MCGDFFLNGLWKVNGAYVLCICIYIYGEKNIVLVLVPRVDSDK